jgi:hypothetical protein
VPVADSYSISTWSTGAQLGRLTQASLDLRPGAKPRIGVTACLAACLRMPATPLSDAVAEAAEPRNNWRRRTGRMEQEVREAARCASQAPKGSDTTSPDRYTDGGSRNSSINYGA